MTADILMTDDVLNLAWLVLRLGKQERITRDPGGRPESVTTHTTMLALVGLLLVPRELPFLSLSRVLVYALVHDLPEALAGDTPTLRALSLAEREEKTRREEHAIGEIRTALPGLASLIESYERQDTPEARFVHLLDKALPKALHTLDQGRMLRDQGVSPEELTKILSTQQERLNAELQEFPLAAALYKALGQLAHDALIHDS